MDTDLFELLSANIFFRVRGCSYKVNDPPFAKKVHLLKRVQALQTKYDGKENPLDLEYLQEMNDINTQSLKLHIPDLPDEVLAELGHAEMRVILNEITSLAAGRFGARMEKIEEKKDLAT
jgi:hypothetical protein